MEKFRIGIYVFLIVALAMIGINYLCGKTDRALQNAGFSTMAEMETACGSDYVFTGLQSATQKDSTEIHFMSFAEGNAPAKVRFANSGGAVEVLKGDGETIVSLPYIGTLCDNVPKIANDRMGKSKEFENLILFGSEKGRIVIRELEFQNEYS